MWFSLVTRNSIAQDSRVTMVTLLVIQSRLMINRNAERRIIDTLAWFTTTPALNACMIYHDACFELMNGTFTPSWWMMKDHENILKRFLACKSVSVKLWVLSSGNLNFSRGYDETETTKLPTNDVALVLLSHSNQVLLIELEKSPSVVPRILLLWMEWALKRTVRCI